MGFRTLQYLREWLPCMFLKNHTPGQLTPMRRWEGILFPALSYNRDPKRPQCFHIYDSSQGLSRFGKWESSCLSSSTEVGTGERCLGPGKGGWAEWAVWLASPRHRCLKPLWKIPVGCTLAPQLACGGIKPWPVGAGLSFGWTTGQLAQERNTLSSACSSAQQAALFSLKAVVDTDSPCKVMWGGEGDGGAGYCPQVKYSKAWLSMSSFCSRVEAKAPFLTQAYSGFCNTFVTMKWLVWPMFSLSSWEFPHSRALGPYQELRFLSPWTQKTPNALFTSSSWSAEESRSFKVMKHFNLIGKSGHLSSLLSRWPLGSHLTFSGYGMQCCPVLYLASLDVPFCFHNQKPRLKGNLGTI